MLSANDDLKISVEKLESDGQYGGKGPLIVYLSIVHVVSVETLVLGQPFTVYNFHDNKRCGDSQFKMIRVQGYIVDHCVERRPVRDVERESAQTGG